MNATLKNDNPDVPRIENFYLHNAHSTKFFQTVNTTWDDIFKKGE